MWLVTIVHAIPGTRPNIILECHSAKKKGGTSCIADNALLCRGRLLFTDQQTGKKKSTAGRPICDGP